MEQCPHNYKALIRLPKKKSGEKYITVQDKATSSWIDFGCTKNMIMNALIAAVVAVVVVALIVGTGGIAAIGLVGMMAIGATAGVAAGVVTAVEGALTCGQKNAGARKWDGQKSNLLWTGTPAITGNRKMICEVGGEVSFAPEVKSPLHAVLLSGLNYVTKLGECAAGGAAVGGFAFMGAGIASGSMSLAAPTLASVWGNVLGGFSGVWGASRALFGLDHLANEHAMGHVNSVGDAIGTTADGAIPEIGMTKRIVTGQAQPMDAMLLLYLLNLKHGGPPPEERSVTENESNNNHNEEGNPNEEEGGQPAGQGESTTPTSEGGEANAFEENPGNSRPGDPEGTYRDSNGRLRDSQTNRFVRDPNRVTPESNVDTTNPTNPNRPSWRQSELDAEAMYQGYDTQKSFINGEEVPYGTEGSTRPDLYTDGHSVEVKNYDVESNAGRNNLNRELTRQYNERVQNLPQGTRQTAVIDVRGQNIDASSLGELETSIQQNCPNLEIIFRQ